MLSNATQREEEEITRDKTGSSLRRKRKRLEFTFHIGIFILLFTYRAKKGQILPPSRLVALSMNSHTFLCIWNKKGGGMDKGEKRLSKAGTGGGNRIKGM